MQPVVETGCEAQDGSGSCLRSVLAVTPLRSRAWSRAQNVNTRPQKRGFIYFFFLFAPQAQLKGDIQSFAARAESRVAGPGRGSEPGPGAAAAARGDQGWAGMRRRLEHVLWDTTGPGSLPVTWGHSSTQKWNSVAKGEPENGGRAAKAVEVSHWRGEEAECIQSQSCWKKMLEKLGKEEERNKLNCLGLL